MPFLISPKILRWVQLFVLAVGLNTGNFSIERFIPVLAFLPDHVLQFRYFCIPLLLALSFWRRDFLTWKGIDRREAFTVLACLGVFLIYAIFRVHGPDFYAALEPYILVFVYAGLTALAIGDRRDAENFLAANLAVSLGILGIYVLSEIVMGPFNLATGYYYSRALFIGFIAAMFFVFKYMDDRDRTKLLGLALVAGIFLAAGIATSMRAAIVLYAVSILVFIPMMLAFRHYKKLGVFLVVTIVAFGLGLWFAADAITIKNDAYTPSLTVIAPEANTAASSAEDQACDKRISDYSLETGDVAVRNPYSCLPAVTIRDADARIRLLIAAIKDVRSPWYGNGLGSYAFVDAARPTSPALNYHYPHNIYAGLYNGAGLIGLSIIGMSLLFVMSACVRSWLADTTATSGILTLLPIFFMLSGAMSGDFYDARYVWIMPFVLAGIAYRGTRETVKEQGLPAG